MNTAYEPVQYISKHKGARSCCPPPVGGNRATGEQVDQAAIGMLNEFWYSIDRPLASSR